ncbi:hypothetical protein OMR07_12195 [Methylobacterium organophilum]|nr:hypothetical protein [Methylobacterium organophilum]
MIGRSLGVTLDASGATEPGISLKRQDDRAWATFGTWSTIRVNRSQLMSAGGSRVSKVRGQVSHSRLQRFVTSR